MIQTLYKASFHGLLVLNLCMCLIYGWVLHVERDAVYGLAVTGRGLAVLPTLTRTLVVFPSRGYFGQHYAFIHILLIPYFIFTILAVFLRLKRCGNDVDLLTIILNLLSAAVTQCIAVGIGISMLFPVLPELTELPELNIPSTPASDACFWLSTLCGTLAASLYITLFLSGRKGSATGAPVIY